MARKLRWIGIVLVSSIAILGLAASLVLNSSRFRVYLLSYIERQASESTGAQVRIQSLALHPLQLAADAYGITVRGKVAAGALPLAQADQLTIRLKIVSLLRKKIDLSEIILRHPVVNLLVKRDGSTNLPSPPKSNSSTNPFDLGIQHVLLDQGELYYNDVKTRLDADIHDLRVEIKAQLLGKGYDGTVSYRNGRVHYGDTNPLPHDLAASFIATPSGFALQPLVLTIASSKIELTGQVRNYSQPSATGTYRIMIHPQDVGRAFKNPGIPGGEVTLTGSLRYQYQENVPPLRAVEMDGHLSSRELAVNTTDLRGDVHNVRGEFKLLNGNLDVRGLEADVLGGHVTATATMQHLDANSTAKLHASVQAISVNAATSALPATNLGPLPLAGQISGTADASWTGSVKNIEARADATLTGALANPSAASSRVPVEAVVHANYDGRSATATLTDTFVHTPQTRIEVNGTAGHALKLNLQAHSNDLKEVESVAAAFQNVGAPALTPTTGPRSINLGGAADLQFVIEGTADDPHIRGKVAGRTLQIANTQWRSLDLTLEASKSGASIQNGSLENAQQGYINFSGGAGLSNWHYLPSGSVTLALSSRDLAIKQLLQTVGLNYPVSGNLSVDVSMHGSQLNPEGSGSVRLVRASVYGQPVQQLSIQAEAHGDALSSTASVSLPGGSAKANLTFYPKRRGYDLQVDVAGIDLGQLQAVREKNLAVAGILTANVSGRGTIDDPQLTLAAHVPRLQIRDANVSDIKADLNVANHEARLALDSEVVETFVQARGTMSLNKGHYTHATLDTKGIPIERLLALYTPIKANGPRGIVELHASAEGPLDDARSMQAQVTIPTLKADYQGLQIGNTQPIRARYANFIVTLDPTEIAGTDTSLRLQGQLPLQGKAPMTLSAVGTVDMQLLRFVQSDLTSSGKLQLDVRASGSAANPGVQGQVRVQNVSIMQADAPVGVQNLNGILDVGNDQLTITQLTGESGGGQVSARGTIRYRPQVQTNIALQAKNVRIRYQDAIRTVLQGDLNLAGTAQAANLNGRLFISNLSFTQNFDLATFAGEVQSSGESAPGQGFANNVKLDITVQTAPNINLTSSEVSLQGQANLHVVGTAADPVIVGRTEFTGGDIFLMKKRYQIERGVLQFSNPRRTEPVLNVLLTTTISQYNLSLTFRGPLDKLQTSYTSDPPLPTADIINLIVRGQTAEQAAASPSSFGASSLLAQGAASQVSNGVQKLAGFSSFSIDPTLGGNNTDPGARVAMQKRVTNNFLFTFATDVTSTQRELIQGEYQFNRRWSASVTRDENGGFAVDGKYHKRF